MATKKKATGGSGTSDALESAVEAAVGGNTKKLFSLLAKGGGTDRGEVDMALAESFARAVAKHGADADDLVEEMAAMDDVDAEEGSPEEFLSVCGLVAYGERVAADMGRFTDALAALERAAQDPRARVRAAADAAVTRMGQAHGPKLLVDRFSAYLKTADVDSFVVNALARAPWLDTFDTAQPIVEKLDQCFRQLAKSPPGLDTIPSAKRMMEALKSTPAIVAKKFPDAIVDFLKKWSAEPGPSGRIPPIVAANVKALPADLAARVGAK